MGAIEREDERAYRKHNITRTSRKMVPDIDNRPTPQARPNPTEMQCQCDQCKAHRKRNAITGVASPSKDV